PLVAAALLLVWSAAQAQQCDDFNTCTANDMCSEGSCTGTLQPGNCDDGDPCTMNDHCVEDEEGVTCRGDDPAPIGTECGGGCGTCQEFMGIPGFVQCLGDPGKTGDACDAGFENPCFQPQCNNGGGFAFCVPLPRECPDTDGNHCNDV